MTIKEKLLNDYKQAMVNKEKLRKDTLQMCRAAVLQVEKDQRVELDDADVIAILAKEYKKRSETLKDLGDRKDIVDRYEEEMAIIEKYLPKQLSEEEVLEVVKEVIASVDATSMKDMGKVMQTITPMLKGKADGKLINNLVRSQLSS